MVWVYLHKQQLERRLHKYLIMKTPTLFFALLLGLLGLYACQSDSDRQDESMAEDQPPIRGNLFVRYIEDDKRLKAEAYFFEGKDETDTKPKHFKGGVQFLGSGMGERSIGDRYYKYQYENTLAWQDNYSFSLTDDAGKTHRFSFGESPKPLTSFELPPAFSKSKTTYISFSPAHLPEGSYVAALLTDADKKVATTKVKGPSEEGKLAITPKLLEKMKNGEVEVYLVRVDSKRIEEPPFSLGFTLEYYTPIKKTGIQP